MNVIKRMRLECGMTQKELAEKLGVTQPTVASYEKNEPQVRTIYKVSKLLNINLNNIRGDAK